MIKFYREQLFCYETSILHPLCQKYKLIIHEKVKTICKGDTGRKLNVHKTFTRRPVSTWRVIKTSNIATWYSDMVEQHALILPCRLQSHHHHLVTWQTLYSFLFNFSHFYFFKSHSNQIWQNSRQAWTVFTLRLITTSLELVYIAPINGFISSSIRPNNQTWQDGRPSCNRVSQ